MLAEQITAFIFADVIYGCCMQVKSNMCQKAQTLPVCVKYIQYMYKV